MLNALLHRLASTALARPWAVMAAAVLPALALTVVGLFMPTDLSFGGILDRSNPEIARYFEQQERLQLGGLLPLLLEGPEEKLDDAAEAVAEVLLASGHVRRVDYEIPEAWVKDHAPYLVDDETFELWLGLATRPDDTEGAAKLKAQLETLAKNVEKLRPDGKRVVMVSLLRDPMAYDMGGGTYFEIEDMTLAALEPLGVTGTYAGLAAVGAQDQVQTLGKIRLLTPLSLVIVLFLFRLIERRFFRLLFVAAPMLLTVGATLGLAGVSLGVITVLESFFGVMVFGLGIDFALHLMVRLREERGLGQPFDAAVTTTLTGAGRGVIAGALTTVGAFFIIGLAPDPLARHLGMSGALGLLTCLALMLTMLPAAWALFERRAPPDETPPTELHLGLVRALAVHAVRHPLLHLALAAALVAIAVAGVPRLVVETDITRVFNRQVPAVAAIYRLQELSGLNAAPWIAASADFDEARRITEAFQALDLVATVESVPALLPAGGPVRGDKLRAAATEIEAQKATYSALIPLVSDDEAAALRGAVQLLEVLERAAAQGAPGPSDLPQSLQGRLRAPTGEYLVMAYAREATLDGARIRDQRVAVQGAWPEASGFNALVEGVTVAERPWAFPVFFGILLFVVVILAIDLRSWRMMALALVPVLVGTSVTFGALCWLGHPFNVMSTLVVPLIIGLGVDDGIHVVHRLKEDRTLPPEVAAASVGKAIVMTTATTCSSFVVLLFTDHAGMEGMSLIMLIGLPLCLLASVTTLPALAKVLGVNQPPAS